jgi:hypothetical protein
VLVVLVMFLRWGPPAACERSGHDGRRSSRRGRLGEGQRRLQLVIPAAHGVLWESHERSDEWLLGIVAMQGRPPVREEVRALRREVELGRLTTAEMWRALGLPAEPRELDAAFVARFTLDPRVVDSSPRWRAVGVGCDERRGGWSGLLRERFGQAGSSGRGS